MRSSSNRFRSITRSLRRDKSMLLGASLFFAILLATLVAPLVAPYDPYKLVSYPLRPLSMEHFLGTDEIGRDIFTRLLYAGRVSLLVGIIATSLGAAIGTPLGIIAGYFGGWRDSIVMRLMDALLAFPPIILALAIISLLGGSITNAMLAISAIFIPSFARVVRSQVIAIKAAPFTEASRAAGASNVYIMARVLLPNCFTVLYVQFSLSYAVAILTESSLSFLGLGTQPPTASWGTMLNAGRSYFTVNPWYSIAAGSAILMSVLSLNLIGDAVRDALDPTLSSVFER